MPPLRRRLGLTERAPTRVAARKAAWLAALTLEKTFLIAEDMDRFSRAMAPEAFRTAPANDERVRAFRRRDK